MIYYNTRIILLQIYKDFSATPRKKLWVTKYSRNPQRSHHVQMSNAMWACMASRLVYSTSVTLWDKTETEKCEWGLNFTRWCNNNCDSSRHSAKAVAFEILLIAINIPQTNAKETAWTFEKGQGRFVLRLWSYAVVTHRPMCWIYSSLCFLAHFTYETGDL